jgi:peptide/nickel transport system substrate-binding protein
MTTNEMRIALLGSVAGILALTLAAPAVAQKKGGDAILGVTSPPPLTDAQASTAEATRNVSMHWIETLFARDEAANPIPDLATKVDVAADGLTYVFALRQGVKFHNGQEFTAEDAKASIERYKRVGGAKGIMEPVSAVEATSRYVVTVKLSTVSPGFINQISAPGSPVAMYPKSEGDKEAGKVNHIGTGPYKFVEYRPDSHVKLSRFEEYVQNPAYTKRDGFGGKKTAYFDNITIRFIPEGGARTAALETGEVHVIDNLPPPSAKRLRGNTNIKIYEANPWYYNLIVLNASQGPTANQKFRQAILAALDLEEITAIAAEGLYGMKHGWQHEGTQYFAGDVGKEHYNQNNVNKAKQLLAESGYKGEEIVFLTDSTIKNHNETAVVATEQLRKKLGLNIKLNVVDWPTAFQLRRKPEGWNLWTVGFGVEPYEGPFNVVGAFTRQNDGKGMQWMEDPVLKDADRRLFTALSLDEGKKAVADFQRRMWEWVPAIKTGDGGRYQATRGNVEGYAPARIPRMWDLWFR